MNLSLLKPKVVHTLTKEFCYKNTIIPIKENEKKILVAAYEKPSEDTLNYIKLRCDKDVEIKFFQKDEIKKTLDYFYFETVKRNALVNNILVNEIINDAIKQKASDIHIEPKEKDLLIRLRIDGSLTLYKIIKKGDYSGILSKVKLMSAMNISESRKPQDGKIYYDFDGEKYDLRVSTIPTVFGEKLVIRILYKNLLYYDIKKLNFANENIEKIKKLTEQENGIILVSGPTGSGKSTTLYALLNEENKSTVNITTIEDPVEIYFDAFNQINVNERIGLSFSNGLRHILRQDPDIVMIGEIRDEETAKIALRAAITGHKVYSTIHTNSCYESFVRLKDMGIKEYILLNAVKGVISQRLVGVMCPYCKRINKLEKLDGVYVYEADGCEKCKFKGISGRILLSDVLVLNDEEKENIKNYLNYNEGFKIYNNLVNNAKKLCVDGIISNTEYKRIKQGATNV